jgi:hypothetical protein
MSGADRGGDPTEPGTEEWAFETGGSGQVLADGDWRDGVRRE